MGVSLQPPVFVVPESSSSQHSMFGGLSAQASLFGGATTLSKVPVIPFGSQPPQFALQTTQPAPFGAQSSFTAQGGKLTSISNPLFSQSK
jgi:hypothetical protein